MNRKLLIAVVLLVTSVILTLVGCTGDEPSSGQESTGSESRVETEKSNTETESVSEPQASVASEAKSEESSEAEESLESDESSESEESSEPDENSVPEESFEPDESSESEESSEPDENSIPEESSEPEDPAEGTKEQPYLEIPESNNMTVTTVSVPAGKSVFYDIYRVGGMIFTIDSANAYVIYEGDRYEAKNGVLSFRIENALASDAISFEIGNSGSSAEAFKITFTNPEGTYANPTVIKTLSGDITVSLEEGKETGYYYRYIAEQDGVIRFYMTATSDSVVLITNNRNSAQRTSESDSMTDEQGAEYVEMEVLKGDELMINVGAKPNRRGKYPATEITWSGKFS